MDPLAIVEPYVPRKSSRRDPWTEQEAREALSAANRSGLTLAAFARCHGLSDRQLYWWHMRLRTHPDIDRGRLAFVPVVQGRTGPAPAWGGIEVAIHDAVVRVEPDFCAQTLARVVAVLRGKPC